MLSAIRSRARYHVLPSLFRRGVGGEVILILLFTLLLAPAFAKDVPAPSVSGLPWVGASDKPDLYDIDASGGDIRYVLEMLARRSGTNIVVSPDVKGEVSAHLKQMTVDAILDHLASVQGFTCKKTGGAYVVAMKQQLEAVSGADTPVKPPDAPATETLVWDCRNTKPTDLVQLITKLFPAVICAEGPSSVSPELDTTSSGLGTSGGSGSSASSSQSTTKPNSNKIVLIGQPADLAKASDVLKRLDVPRQQVSIDVAITEISSNGSRDLGIDWSWGDLGIAETNESGIGFGKFNKQGMTIGASLSALIKDGKATLLAQPNVSVLDGACADILIGDRILFPKLVGYNQIGTPLYDKAEEKVGIYMQIAPKIAGDQIVLTLYPQVSLVTGYLKTQAGDYPQISTREARTTVSVTSGATLAIGGLLRQNEIENASKFPVLGDIPVLGHLFRHNKKTKEQTEIVILLSPRIVDEKNPPQTLPGKLGSQASSPLPEGGIGGGQPVTNAPVAGGS